jgi:hypothetical protein
MAVNLLYWKMIGYFYNDIFPKQNDICNVCIHFDPDECDGRTKDICTGEPEQMIFDVFEGKKPDELSFSLFKQNKGR